jgi:RecB family endonuclease NucS
VAVIEPGLTLIEGGVEYRTDAGRIDLLAKDATASLVVFELEKVRKEAMSALDRLDTIQRAARSAVEAANLGKGSAYRKGAEFQDDA